MGTRGGANVLVLRGSGYIGSGNELIGGIYGHDIPYFYGESNALIGGCGNDTLYSYGVNNSLYGDTGDDSYVVTSQSTRIFEDVGSFGGNDTVYAEGTDYSIDLSASNVETLVILSSDHIGAGSDRSDRLTAYGANNTLLGGGGDDTLAKFGRGGMMAGGTGNDTFVVTDRNTLVFESVADGNDTIYADGIDFSLSDAPNVEAVVLRGNGHVGAGTNNADLLISAGISNTLFGGEGNDIFSFVASRGQSKVLDFNARIGEHDVVAFARDQFDSFSSLQNHFSQVWNDTVVSSADSNGDTFTMKNVVAAHLTASDFLFV